MSSLRNQFVALTVARLIGAGFQALLLIALARSVEPATFGLVSVVAAVGLIGAGLFDAGAQGAILKARAHSDQKLVEALLALNQITTALMAGVAVAILTTFSLLSSAPAWLLVYAFSLALEKHSETSLSVTIADGAILTQVVNIVLRRAVSIGMFIALTVAGLDPLGSFAVASLVAAAGGVAQLTFYLRKRGLHPAYAAVRRYARTGVPFMVNTLSAQARSLDIPLLAATSGAATAGIYSAVSKLTTPFALVATALGSTLLPHAARSGRHWARRVSLVLVAIGTAGTLVLVQTGPLLGGLVDWLFGAAYVGAGALFQTLMYIIPVLLLSSPLASVLQGLGMQMYVAATGTVYAVVVLPAMLVGALITGPQGVAVAIIALLAIRAVALLARLWCPAR
jgi:O-antigen/teichoic acid export membrane protein